MVEQNANRTTMMNTQKTISEEFNLPLTNSLVLLESLINLVKDEKALKLLRLILQQIQTLNFFVVSLIDLILIEENKFVANKEVFNPKETFKQVFNIFEPFALMQNTQLIFQPSQEMKGPKNHNR